MNHTTLRGTIALLLSCAVVSCGGRSTPDAEPLSVQSASDFVAEVNRDLVGILREGNAAGFTQATHITPDTQFLNARATERYLEFFSNKAAQARAIDGAGLDPSTARSLELIKLSVSAPAPADAAKRTELATLGTELEAMYGEGKYCKDGHQPQLRRTDRGLDGLACHRASDEAEVPALRGARQRGRA
jgi:peptidyl-dipeptidase A